MIRRGELIAEVKNMWPDMRLITSRQKGNMLLRDNKYEPPSYAEVKYLLRQVKGVFRFRTEAWDCDDYAQWLDNFCKQHSNFKNEQYPWAFGQVCSKYFNWNIENHMANIVFTRNRGFRFIEPQTLKIYKATQKQEPYFLMI
jgi:hypothetical protein